METITALRELLEIFKEDMCEINYKIDHLTDEIRSMRLQQTQERKPEYYGKE